MTTPNVSPENLRAYNSLKMSFSVVSKQRSKAIKAFGQASPALEKQFTDMQSKLRALETNP